MIIEESDNRKRIHRLAIWCVALWVVGWGISFLLGAAGKSAYVGGASSLAGAAAGLSLAGITRTRRTGLIYLGAIIFIACFFIPGFDIPSASQYELALGDTWPQILRNYFDVWRWVAFLLGLPLTFVRFGWHRPDPID